MRALTQILLIAYLLFGLSAAPVLSAGLDALSSLSPAEAESLTPEDPIEVSGPGGHLTAHPSEGIGEEERPLEGRVAVVLVHGYGKLYQRLPGVAGALTWTGFVGALEQSQAEGLSATEDLKLFYYNYRPVKPFPELAAEFADQLVERLLTGPDAARKVILVAHSAGTLMSRYAAADPRIQPRVAGIFTLAGIHRGSVQASLVTARGLEERPGLTPGDLELLEELRGELGVDPRITHPDPAERLPCEDDPTCAVLESIAYDNFDGSITPEDQSRYGMMVNQTLAAFNESDPNLDRIYAYHAFITDLGTELERRPLLGRIFGSRNAEPRQEVPTQSETERRLLEAIHPGWSTADPLVTWESGIFEDSTTELAGQVRFENINHRDILWDEEVQTQLVSDVLTLVELAKQDQEHRLLAVLRNAVRSLRRAAQHASVNLGFDGLFHTAR